jgi:hypothetical protein
VEGDRCGVAGVGEVPDTIGALEDPLDARVGEREPDPVPAQRGRDEQTAEVVALGSGMRGRPAAGGEMRDAPEAADAAPLLGDEEHPLRVVEVAHETFARVGGIGAPLRLERDEEVEVRCTRRAHHDPHPRVRR